MKILFLILITVIVSSCVYSPHTKYYFVHSKNDEYTISNDSNKLPDPIEFSEYYVGDIFVDLTTRIDRNGKFHLWVVGNSYSSQEIKIDNIRISSENFKLVQDINITDLPAIVKLKYQKGKSSYYWGSFIIKAIDCIVPQNKDEVVIHVDISFFEKNVEYHRTVSFYMYVKEEKRLFDPIITV